MTLRNRNPSRCAHPHRFSALDPKSTENEVIDLLCGIVSAAQPDWVLETGTHHGRATLRIAATLIRNGQGSLDTIERDPQLAAVAEAALVGHPVIVHCADINTWEPPRGRSYGVAFFDTDDKANLATHFQRLRDGGFIPVGAFVIFHDTGDDWPTRDTLRPLEAEGALTIHDYPTPRGVAVCQVQ